MIRFSCPGCGAVFSVTDDKAGKTGKCPKCQTPFTIPAAEAPAPAAPPPPPSNPFSDLGDAPPKKKPSKADLDDDLPPPKKKAPSKADLDDEDDRPKKKGRRDDDEDDAPPPKKKPARRDDEDDFAFDAAPKKKGRRDDDEDDAPPPKKKGRRDDDEDDAPPPKKKPARAADLDDDEDDRPKKKASRRDDEDDFDDEDDRPRKRKGRRDDDDDDYDDRPRKTKKSGLLLTVSILHIVAACLYIPCGLIGLLGSSVLGAGADMGGAAVKTGRDFRNTNPGGKVDPDFERAMRDFDKAMDKTVDKGFSDLKTFATLMQIVAITMTLGAIAAIPAAVGGFMKKKWFAPVSLAVGGLFILFSLISLVASFMYIFVMLSALLMALLPLAFGVFFVLAGINKNVKRALS